MKLCAPHEIRAFALLAEAEILDLHDVDDRIVIVGGDDIDVRRADPGLRIHFVAIERPSATILNWIVGIGVVPLDGRQNTRIGQVELLSLAAAQHQKRLRAGARHDAVVEAQGICDRSRRQIFVET